MMFVQSDNQMGLLDAALLGKFHMPVKTLAEGEAVAELLMMYSQILHPEPEVPQQRVFRGRA